MQSIDLALIMHKRPKKLFFRAVYEPWAFVDAHRSFQTNQLKWSHYVHIVKAIVDCVCLTAGNEGVLVFVLPIFCTAMVEVIAEVYPQAKHIFCTRKPRSSIEEIHKVHLSTL